MNEWQNSWIIGQGGATFLTVSRAALVAGVSPAGVEREDDLDAQDIEYTQCVLSHVENRQRVLATG